MSTRLKLKNANGLTKGNKILFLERMMLCKSTKNLVRSVAHQFFTDMSPIKPYKSIILISNRYEIENVRK